MFKINGEAESPHKGAHLGGVLNKMYDEPISLEKHANVASGRMQQCTLTVSQASQQRGQMSIHSNGLFCTWTGQGSRVCGRTVHWFWYQGLEPCFRKAYFLHIPNAKTNRSNELTFDLVAHCL